jgi:hypothetical protein
VYRLENNKLPRYPSIWVSVDASGTLIYALDAHFKNNVHCHENNELPASRAIFGYSGSCMSVPACHPYKGWRGTLPGTLSGKPGPGRFARWLPGAFHQSNHARMAELKSRHHGAAESGRDSHGGHVAGPFHPPDGRRVLERLSDDGRNRCRA